MMNVLTSFMQIYTKVVCKPKDEYLNFICADIGKVCLYLHMYASIYTVILSSHQYSTKHRGVWGG